MERLIGNIYDALEDDSALAALPDLIADEIGARSCTIQVIGSDNALEDLIFCHFTDEMNLFYAEQGFHKYDAWTNALDFQTDLGRALRFSERISGKEFIQSFFYNEFIRHFGDDSVYCLGFGDKLSGGAQIRVGLHVGKGMDDFSDQQLAALEAVRPHLTRMLELRRKVLRREQVATGALVGINSIEDAYLVIRPDRGILFANASAEALLQEAQLLKSSTGRLELESPAGDARLTQCLHDALGRKVEGRTAFVSRDRSGQAWRFTLAPKIVEDRNLVLVWIDRGKVGATAPERLQQLYELTSAEVPILMALSEGRSAQEIADLQSVSVATIRTHIQHIYTKTDVNKASQLATLVASLPKV